MLWSSDVTSDNEPRRVTLVRGEWVDAGRHNRRVPYKIYVPEKLSGDTKFPVIIWSHGLGGSRDGAGFISRYVAAHGYIIVHIQHIGTDSILWEGMPGHPWDNIRKARIARKTVLQRYRDVPFVLECLRSSVESWAPDMDLSRLGMSGHSFGALTTQIMAGQRIVRGSRHYDLHEKDFVAGILYSPVPARRDPKDPGFVYGGIRMPLLYMTGTDDESPIEGFGMDKRVQVFDHAGGQGHILFTITGGDHMVYNGSRGQLADNPARARHEEMIRVLSLAWWDAYLKGDGRARDWLYGDRARAYIAGDGSISLKQ